jgi:lipoxygenase homology domain-containing protein 1
LRSRDGREGSWHCQEVAVKDLITDTTYIFPVVAWLDIDDRPQVFDLGEKSETAIAKTRTLENVKYEVSVVTGAEKGAGTDANVSIILYGENGDTGLRPLKQSFKNLFEKGQTDKFIIECLDLGELQKLHVEHDNSSFFKSVSRKDSFSIS